MISVCCLVALLTTLLQPLVAQPSNPCIKSCDGQLTGNYQSCNACNVYVTCVHGILYDNRPCPAGLVWDDIKKLCDYTSNTCSKGQDYCEPNPCQNGGVCTNGDDTFVCSCQSGYVGVDCSGLDYCNQCETSPCIDGGQCTNDGDSYTCTYLPGNDELDCFADTDPCSSPALNECDPANGQCTSDSTGGYHCDCKEGYKGNGETCTEITYSSCADIYKQNPQAENSTYSLQNAAGESFTVYCEFYPTHLYTFIAPTMLDQLDMSDLYNNHKEVVIRHRLNNGKQLEVKYGQIQKYRALDISVQYNTSIDYKGFLNRGMGPYVYIGLLPQSGITHKGDVQGYSVNGRDQTFTNCDGNPNTYFVLLFNEANVDFNGYRVDSPFMRKWIGASTPVMADRELPVEFFSLFEMHMGGCGGYLTTDMVVGMAGATIGLRHDFRLSSCKDVFDMASSNTGPISGEYYLTNDEGEAYKVYCEFYDTHFYSFIAPTSLTSIPVDQLYNNLGEILIRYRNNDGQQYQSTYGQIDKYSTRDISIQYSASLGYNPIKNKQMGPYLYAGLLPKSGINHRKDIQGYSVNGVDKKFKNCDGNPNSYFSLLYNADNKGPSSYNVVTDFMKYWITNNPVPSNRYLPDNYFSFFEMHMGGCGGYITLNHIPGMAGVVFGLKYDL